MIYGVVLALFVGFVGLLWFLRQETYKRGRGDARTSQAEETLKVKNAQQKAAARSPRDRDELVGRMRDGDF